MKKFLLIAVLLIASCSSTSSKNDDLKSPCAGCDERVSPIDNTKYLG